MSTEDADSSSAVAASQKNDGMKAPKFRIPILSDMRDDIDAMVTCAMIHDRSLHALIRCAKHLLGATTAILVLLVAILITLLVK